MHVVQENIGIEKLTEARGARRASVQKHLRALRPLAGAAGLSGSAATSLRCAQVKMNLTITKQMKSGGADAPWVRAAAPSGRRHGPDS